MLLVKCSYTLKTLTCPRQFHTDLHSRRCAQRTQLVDHSESNFVPNPLRVATAFDVYVSCEPCSLSSWPIVLVFVTDCSRRKEDMKAKALSNMFWYVQSTLSSNIYVEWNYRHWDSNSGNMQKSSLLLYCGTYCTLTLAPVNAPFDCTINLDTPSIHFE